MSGASSASVYLSVATTAPTVSLSRPAFRGRVGLGGAVLAFLIFLGVPTRRGRWRALLGMLIIFVAFASLNACGGGGGSTGGGGVGGNVTGGTTPGTYTFTVTATGSPAVTPAPTATFNVTVN